MQILAIDVGTSSVKAGIVDPEGNLLGPIGRQAYALDHPTPDAAEVPAGRVWGAIVAACRQITGERGGKAVSGLGLSCLTPALVLLDKKDEPIFPSWIHLDRRGREAALRVQKEVGAEFLAECGNRPLPGGISAVCFRALAGESPAGVTRTRTYLHLNGWLGLHLTGEKFFDPANASFTGLYSTLRERKWSPRWCRYFQVDPKWLPPVISGDRTIGALRAEAAQELGLSAGIEVKLGTADTTSAMLAVGLGEGELLHVVGTTQVLAAKVARPVPGERRLVREIGVGDGYLHVSHNPVGGAALEWLRTLCFGDRSAEAFYAEDVPEAVRRGTHVQLDPPYLGGDRLQIEPRFASLQGLSLWTERLDLLGSIIQAMQRGHRQALADLGLTSRPRRVFMTGGAASLMRDLLDDYPKEQVQLVEEGSLRGVGKLFQLSAGKASGSTGPTTKA